MKIKWIFITSSLCCRRVGFLCSIQIFLFNYRHVVCVNIRSTFVSNVSLDKYLYLHFQISLTVTFIS